MYAGMLPLTDKGQRFMIACCFTCLCGCVPACIKLILQKKAKYEKDMFFSTAGGGFYIQLLQ
jgi:hypothetical protein